MMYPNTEDPYNGYAVTVVGESYIELSCIDCGRPLLTLPAVYLSYLTRTALTHTQVCPVVNTHGAHSAVS